jgi:hypothetical protein
MWTPDKLWRLLSDDGERLGITGFSGQCAQLAFCAQESLYPDAEVVGAFNAHLYKKGELYGHVFLYKNGVYFDAKQASRDIKPFLPLTKLDYMDNRINPQKIVPSRLIKQKADDLIILRHLTRDKIPGLSRIYYFVCDIFV